MLSTALFLFVVSLLSGCQGSPKANLDDLAKESSLNQPLQLHTDYFTLVGWGTNKYSKHANIYIEGDGQAWEDPWTISVDPSPSDPVGFRLAQADSRSDSILYFSRPCQYVVDKRCSPLDWTSNRFGPRVVETYLQAFNQMKQAWGIKTFSLHAYSGGASIALLIAATRQDIKEVITFAPLLDHHQWAMYHKYSPLSGSLSPHSFAKSLKNICQLHFIGQNDKEVPYEVSQHYFAHIPLSPYNRVQLVPQFDHHSDWPDVWKSYILNSK